MNNLKNAIGTKTLAYFDKQEKNEDKWHQDHERAWVRTVHPNKEFFNATHLIVTVPNYYEDRLTQPLKV